MTKLSKEQILMLHSMAIKQSGGLDGVRDGGLLDMALHAPFQTFESTESYIHRYRVKQLDYASV
jgi:death on curing protein